MRTPARHVRSTYARASLCSYHDIHQHYTAHPHCTKNRGSIPPSASTQYSGETAKPHPGYTIRKYGLAFPQITCPDASGAVIRSTRATASHAEVHASDPNNTDFVRSVACTRPGERGCAMLMPPHSYLQLYSARAHGSRTAGERRAGCGRGRGHTSKGAQRWPGRHCQITAPRRLWVLCSVPGRRRRARPRVYSKLVLQHRLRQELADAGLHDRPAEHLVDA